MKLVVHYGNPNLSINFNGNNLNVSTGTPIVRDYSDLDIYDGDYIVTPKASEQTVLQTRAKAMIDDVTVLEIPYTSVSNLSGGNTVTIGG